MTFQNDQKADGGPRTAWALRSIYGVMSQERRRHLRWMLALMLVGGLAELLTIGAVIPFLALLAAPEQVSSVPGMEFLLALTGGMGDEDLIVPATLFLVIVAALAGAVRLAVSWVSTRFVFRLGHELGMTVYSRMLRQPYNYFVTRNTSEVIAGVEKIQSVIFAVLLPIIQAVVSAVMALFIVLLLFLLNPLVALTAAVSMGLIYLGVSFATRKLLKINSSIIATMQTRRVQQVQEGLGGIRDILIDQSHAVFEDSFRRLDNDLRNAQTFNVFAGTAPRYAVESAGVAMIALLALYMSFQPGGVIAAIPVLGALALGAQRLLPLLQLIYVGWSQFAGSFDLLVDVVRLMHAPVVGSVALDRREPLDAFKRDIVFKGVDFRYNGSEAPALHDISLTIAKGERLGLIGKTGSGKSTLLDLLMGLLEPTSGQILIDGVRLDDTTRSRWQAQVAHVPQFIYLLDASIAANIAFGEPIDQIDMERVRLAAAKAQIDTFIMDLPDAYATEVGERGIRLSGGQRQRLGIARALYKRANVLIFDEATSALDDSTEAAVIGSVFDEARELTLVMIAHRLSTLKGCDRLIRMDAGRIVEAGSYDQIIGQPPLARAK